MVLTGQKEAEPTAYEIEKQKELDALKSKTFGADGPEGEGSSAKPASGSTSGTTPNSDGSNGNGATPPNSNGSNSNSNPANSDGTAPPAGNGSSQ